MLAIEKTSDTAGQPRTINGAYGQQRRGMLDLLPTTLIGKWLVVWTTNWRHPRDFLQTLFEALDFVQSLR